MQSIQQQQLLQRLVSSYLQQLADDTGVVEVQALEEAIAADPALMLYRMVS